MTQFLDCKDTDFLLYYTRPSKSGKDASNEPDPSKRFEHAVRIPYSAIRQAVKLDSTPDDGEVIVACPCGCGAVATVAITGGEESQRLHARYKSVKEKKPYIELTIIETMALVKAKGGEPRLDPKKG